MLFVALCSHCCCCFSSSTIVMSTASSAVSTSSDITVSSGTSGSSAAPTAASAPPSASSSSSVLYSHLLRSLYDSTRRQIKAAMARALLSPSAPLTTVSGTASGMQPYALTLSCTHTRACLLQAPLPGYQFVLHPLPPLRSILPSPSASIAQKLTLS